MADAVHDAPAGVTHASPSATIWRWASAQPIFGSNALDGLRISTITVPLERARFAGRRTSTRVEPDSVRKHKRWRALSTPEA
jgi:hypothetical protein